MSPARTTASGQSVVAPLPDVVGDELARARAADELVLVGMADDLLAMVTV